MNTYDKRAIYFTFLFLLRRVLFVATVAFFKFSIVFQVLVTDILSTILLAFYLSVRPLNGILNNGIEILNETAVLSSIQLMFVFTDYTVDPVKRYAHGYHFMYYIASVICLNLLAYACSLIKNVIDSTKRHYMKK